MVTGPIQQLSRGSRSRTHGDFSTHREAIMWCSLAVGMVVWYGVVWAPRGRCWLLCWECWVVRTKYTKLYTSTISECPGTISE